MYKDATLLQEPYTGRENVDKIKQIALPSVVTFSVASSPPSTFLFLFPRLSVLSLAFTTVWRILQLPCEYCLYICHASSPLCIEKERLTRGKKNNTMLQQKNCKEDFLWFVVSFSYRY